MTEEWYDDARATEELASFLLNEAREERSYIFHTIGQARLRAQTLIAATLTMTALGATIGNERLDEAFAIAVFFFTAISVGFSSKALFYKLSVAFTIEPNGMAELQQDSHDGFQPPKQLYARTIREAADEADNSLKCIQRNVEGAFLFFVISFFVLIVGLQQGWA